ncbi:YceI family protein [Candidatus Uhrbacteria bacterium]|nr:YceI family protein [Candidatus Uhrbacteria bacterium]
MKISTPLIVGAVLIAGSIYIVSARTDTPKGAQKEEPTPVVLEEKAPAAKEEISGSGTFALDTAASVLHWVGRKPAFIDYLDRGTVDLSSGELTLKDGTVTAGTFTIDFTTIAVDSTGKNAGETMLAAHLKSKDFFEVETYPTGTFTLDSIKKIEGEMLYEVTGNLTVKGITRQVTFPATIYKQGNALRAQAQTQLDRSKWNIKYNSGSFFKNLGEKIIDDQFLLTLDLVALAEN